MILKKIIEVYNKKYEEQSPIVRAKAVYLFYILTIVFILALVMVIRGDLSTPLNINLGYYSGLIFSPILLLILYKGNYSLASNFSSICFTASISIGLVTGSFDEFDIAYLLLLIVFTFFYTSFKTATLVTLYTIMLIAIIFFTKRETQSFRTIFMINSFASIVLIYILASLNHKILNNYVKKVSRQQEVLEQTVMAEKIRNQTNSKLYDQLEKERSLIAFELHDDIAQKLAIIKRHFSIKNSIDDHTLLMENYSSDVIKRIRYLSRMLNAPDNLNVSFKVNLETLFSDFSVLSDFKLKRKTVGLNALVLQPTAALHIYRIIQEILTNSRVHSEATEIELLIVYSHPTLNIKYSDNGKGFDPFFVYRKGIGMESIKYRVDILKGNYNLHSEIGEGTDISIDIPIELIELK